MSGVLAVMDGEISSAEALAVSDAYQAERLQKLREARTTVAELIEAGSAAHMALIGYLPAHRNAVTSCAIARIEAALARCGGQS